MLFYVHIINVCIHIYVATQCCINVRTYILCTVASYVCMNMYISEYLMMKSHYIANSEATDVKMYNKLKYV